MLKRIASLLLISVVAACGGSGDAGTSLYGGGAGAGPVATDVLLTSSKATLDNTVGATVTLTATAVDAGRNVVPAAVLTLSADNDAVLSGLSGTVTSAQGVVTANLGVGSSRANRVITITARSGSITKTITVQVSGTSIRATLVPAVVAPGAQGQVQYQALDATGNPMAGQAVGVAAAGLTPTDATGTTDVNGKYTFTYTAPATTGAFNVVATIAGFTDSQTINVQPTNTVPDVTATIGAASVSATPSVVAVNLAGGTANQSVVRALFKTSGNQPIGKVRVRFDLAGDVNSVGGTFSAGSGTLYSDDNGVVTTSYVPATRSSPTNGVTIRACYGKTDAAVLTCSTFATTTLTVTSEPLGVSIGTNNVILLKTLTYVKQYVVTVADSAGNPKAGVTLATSVDLPIYRKGFYSFTQGQPAQGGQPAIPGGWGKSSDTSCPAEDKDRNGVLDAGEDANGDGQLWPRKPDVLISFVDANGNLTTATTTAADGSAVLQIEYAQNHASWVDALITVVASGVGGSEGRATYFVSPVPVPTSTLTDANQPPPFAVSPYGSTTSCANPN